MRNGVTMLGRIAERQANVVLQKHAGFELRSLVAHQVLSARADFHEHASRMSAMDV
jgi:hypothetical protein